MEPAPVHFGFVLIPGFSLLSFSCAVDVLRAASLEDPEVGFTWQLLAPDVATTEAELRVASSGGIELAAQAPGNLSDFDAIIICGGVRSHEYLDVLRTGKLGAELRAAARSGALVGSLSDGAYLMAAAGLFDTARSTIHWKCQSAYREMFPDLDVRASLMEVDGQRVSCAGGTASLDLMLHLVARSVGWDVAGRIADNYIHDRMRSDDEMKFASQGFRFANRVTGLGEAIADMEANIETPLMMTQLAARQNISTRQLDRLFRRALGKSPSEHYRELRVMRAAGLLRQSDLSVAEIAVACGFTSASHLGRVFKPILGHAPSAYRRQSRLSGL